MREDFPSTNTSDGQPRATGGDLPYFDSRVAAGFPSPAEGYADGRLNLNEYLIRHPQATFFVRVKGDSMMGASIFDDDLLVVDRAAAVRSGDIAVAAVNGEFCVKRYERSDAGVSLRSAHPDYPDIELTPQDEWAIWGRVIYSIHKH
jgi:DNA polymerase V